MNTNYIFANRHQVPAEYVQDFTRKPNLSTLEHIGLETVLCKFVEQYELETFGETYSTEFDSVTRWNVDGVDILDGCYDTYIFDQYAIESIWCTENGAILLTCYYLQHDEYDDPDDVVRYTDWQSECQEVVFRLD